jgi:hypothetical protein
VGGSGGSTSYHLRLDRKAEAPHGRTIAPNFLDSLGSYRSQRPCRSQWPLPAWPGPASVKGGVWRRGRNGPSTGLQKSARRESATSRQQPRPRLRRPNCMMHTAPPNPPRRPPSPCRPRSGSDTVSSSHAVAESGHVPCMPGGVPFGPPDASPALPTCRPLPRLDPACTLPSPGCRRLRAARRPARHLGGRRRPRPQVRPPLAGRGTPRFQPLKDRASTRPPASLLEAACAGRASPVRASRYPYRPPACRP